MGWIEFLICLVHIMLKYIENRTKKTNKNVVKIPCCKYMYYFREPQKVSFLTTLTYSKHSNVSNLSIFSQNSNYLKKPF